MRKIFRLFNSKYWGIITNDSIGSRHVTCAKKRGSSPRLFFYFHRIALRTSRANQLDNLNIGARFIIWKTQKSELTEFQNKIRNTIKDKTTVYKTKRNELHSLGDS